MLIKDHLSHAGQHLFRWRSYVLLGFLPFLTWAITRGEPVEALLGAFWGETFEILAISLVVAGEALRVITIGYKPGDTSGRNVHAQVAQELNTTGLYSVVRNPLYLGNCMMYVGIALFTQDLVLAVVMVLILALYYERIIAAEESFLAAKFGAAYHGWADRTPAIIPALRGWEHPALPFSLRTVLRREQASLFGAALALYLIEVGQHLLGGEVKPVEPGWHLMIGAAALAYLTLRLLKHRSRLLHAPGR